MSSIPSIKMPILLREGVKFDLIEVEIPQVEAGGGGVRCATREYLFL
ncbi:MAG: hypothetical protein J7J65_05385 [Candidatus Korarchaeota archaeon]|nr:hypothetical protein [Candidatus Korarchaeota archaeon]